jgi:hypothetical protein
MAMRGGSVEDHFAGGWQGHADISEYIFDGIFK